MKGEQLTRKQERFVAEYLVDFNATQAAIRAGYSKKTAYSIGQENLKKPEIAAALGKRKARLDEKAGLTTERVARELAMRCFHDKRKMFDERGAIIPIHLLDEETAAGIDGFDVVEMAGGMGMDAESGVAHVPMYTKKLKLVDKTAALALAMRHLGMLKDRVEHTGADGAPLFDPSRLSDAELAAMLAMVAKGQVAPQP